MKTAYIRGFKKPDKWSLTVLLITILVLLPMGAIFLSSISPKPDIWKHIAETILTDLLINTFILSAGTILGTFLIGVSLAWIVAVYDFPGRKIFSWALLLPFAMPAYVMSFVYLGLFDFTGPIQTFMRKFFPTAPSIPDIRSASGVILVMSLCLYPYVYLLARNAFKTQGKRGLEVAQSMGQSRTKAFFTVVLPGARPWIAGGLMLVLMEVLADFGSVSIFNYNTFTTAIYKAWFGFFSIETAAQLSSILVIIALVVVVTEQKIRSRMQYSQIGSTDLSELIKLKGAGRWLATGYASLILSVAFLIPLTQLFLWSKEIIAEELNIRYLELLMNSVTLSVIATIIIVFCAIVLTFANRMGKSRIIYGMTKISTLGYALPGAVLAVGIVMVFGSMDKMINFFSMLIAGVEPGPVFQGTLVTIFVAYMIRFLAVAFHSVESSMHRVTTSMDDAATLHGVTGFSLIRRVHLPVIKAGVFTASILVFVDVMKEMPITLMTRPFGWDTLSVKIFELTSEGEWMRAALPSVVLVLCGLIPVIFLNRQSE